MEKTQEQIWHCPCEPDRELARILVRELKSDAWYRLAAHLGKPYPYTLAGKFDLIYRLMGCKK